MEKDKRPVRVAMATVLMLLMTSCAYVGPRPAAPPLKGIVDTLRDAGSFKTLLSALDAAGLKETLASGSFTLFAPTDEAFGKLPPGTVEDLLKPEKKGALRDLLLYHLVSGRYSAKELPGVMSLTTVQGKALTLGYRKSPLIIDGAPVTQPDVEALNGVIHVISGVLNPK